MLAPFTAGAMPTSQIEMTLSCRNLMNTDILSKSDPYCIVSMKDSQHQDLYYEIGRTERIDDNLNPEWVKKFILNYNFETVQKMKFEVWDVDPSGEDFLGHFETTLADIVSFSGRQFVGNLSGIPGRSLGQIIIVTEEIASCKQIAKIKFAARNLPKLSWFSSNDPFLVISRSNEDGSSSVVFKTEMCHGTQNPTWPSFTARVTTLCNGDYDRNIKIDCYDSRRNGNHKLIGTAHTSFRSLQDNKTSKIMNLIDPHRKDTNANKSAVLEVVSIEVTEETSFLDYIRHGTQMHFAVAIDFTASNGAPADPTSLHFINAHRPNNYEIALRSVGNIIEHYDRSQLFPAFGFGAKLPPAGNVSHQFPLNNNPSHPYCKNILNRQEFRKILQYYHQQLRWLETLLMMSLSFKKDCVLIKELFNVILFTIDLVIFLIGEMAKQKWSMNNLTSQHLTNEILSEFTTNVMPTSQIEMTLSCRDLMNADLLSKSDPYCIVSMKQSQWQDRYFEIGRTERIDDNLNPEWVKKFVLSYNFETVQKMKFEVWDVDPDGQDFLGEFETTLADIVSCLGRQFVGNLTGIPGRRLGQIVIVTEEVTSCKQIVKMKFSAKNLRKLSWFSSNNPFLVISRSNEDNSSSVVYKTQMCRRTQNPIWPLFGMRVTTLCNGDYDRNLKIDCFDNRWNGNHKLIGTAHTSLRSLCENRTVIKHMGLIDPAKQSRQNNYTNSGVLEVEAVEIIEEISFLDYIRHGTQMHFVVAIDFTASNGAPTDPTSLHFIHAHRPNYYEIALRSVGDIIQHYDRSQLYPAFGFGAKLPPTGNVSHQFPLNNNPSHPYCKNVEEIRTHYLNRLYEVQLYGPTNFAPVINNTISIASQYQDGKHYFVLLIITDGIISDMHQTKHAIVSASALPISIIIVGVGDADFEAMDELDSDDFRLMSQVDLAKAVLEEIPGQLTGFMRSRGLRPEIKTKIASDSADLVPTAPIFELGAVLNDPCRPAPFTNDEAPAIDSYKTIYASFEGL
ncbi:Copine-8, partial [Pseudolycoriella hygida]